MRRIAIGNLRNLADTSRIEVFDGGREQGKPLRLRQTAILDGRLRIHREWPRPHRAVVIGRLARRILVARIHAPIERMHGVERPNAARHDQPRRCLQHLPDEHLVRNNAKRQRKELVGANRVIAPRPRRRFAIGRVQAIGQTVSVREQPHQRIGGAIGERVPLAAQEAQRGNPERLNLHRIADARRTGRIVRIHPREMRGRPHEPRIRIDMDAVGRTRDIVRHNGLQDIRERASATIDLEQLSASFRHEIAHGDDEPQLGIGRIAVAGRLAVDDVGQRAVFLEAREGDDDVGRFAQETGGDRAAQEDERITSPIEEPGIARENGLDIVALDDE